MKLDHLILVIESASFVSEALGVKCARDCLLEWNTRGDAALDETVNAWKLYLHDIKTGAGLSETTRHGALVPAIPL